MPETTKIYVWFDCETTGLDPQFDTVLEVAWAFTDENLDLISPIYQRLTALSPAYQRSSYNMRKQVPPFDPTDLECWGEPAYFASPEAYKVVHAMHADSGLIEDFQTINPRRIVRDAAELSRLFLDTFADVEDSYEAGTEFEMILSGDGVSHFDSHVLNVHLPELFPLLPSWDHPLAYYYFDVSPARRIIGKTSMERVARWAADSDDSPFALVECTHSEDFVMAPDDIVVRAQDRPKWFDRSKATAHRAADDMIVSLLDARLIRFLGAHGAGDLTSQY